MKTGWTIITRGATADTDGSLAGWGVKAARGCAAFLIAL